jgi:glycosyltransferase involved in cell wall biosynthesis
MKILQVCFKPPKPTADGGCLAMDSITQGLLEAGHDVQVLSIATEKHPDRRDELPSDYLEATSFDSVFLDTRVRVIPAALNLLSKDSYNITRFNSDDFRRKLISTLQSKKFDIVQLEGLPTMNYLGDVRSHSAAKIVYRAHNVEHGLWKRVAAGATGLKKIYLELLTRRLETYEREQLNSADGIAVITDGDAMQLRDMGCTLPILHLPFAVPLEQAPQQQPNNVFFHIGAMDWEPNLEAMRFLTTQIWPIIREQRPGAVLRLAGRKMPDSFQSGNGIVVDGEVPDAYAYMRENGILLTPLLSGGGMRIKLIEAMALARAVVSTSVGIEGIPAENGKHAAIADSAEAFAAAAIRMYDDAGLRERCGEAARQLVMENFDRAHATERLVGFYQAVA